MSPAEIMLLLCQAILGLTTAVSVLAGAIALHAVLLAVQLVMARRAPRAPEAKRQRRGAR